MLVQRNSSGRPLGWSIKRGHIRGLWLDVATMVPLFAMDSLATREMTDDVYYNSTARHARGSFAQGFFSRASYATAIGGGPPLDRSGGLITTSTGNGRGDFSFTVVAAPRSESRRVRLFHQRLGSGASNQFILEVNFNNTAVAPGYVTFGTYNVAWTRVAAGPNLTDGKPHWYTCVRKGTRLHIYVDGEEINSAGGTLRDIHSSGQVTSIGGPAGLSGDQNCLDPIYFVAGWNRALTSSEVRALWHPLTRWSWLQTPGLFYSQPEDVPPVVPMSYDMLV